MSHLGFELAPRHGFSIISPQHIYIAFFGCDFSDCCHPLLCGKLKLKISASVSSGLSLVSLVYLGIEMIQPGKSCLKFEC